MSQKIAESRRYQKPSMDATVGKLIEDEYKKLTTNTPHAYALALLEGEARFLGANFDEAVGRLLIEVRDELDRRWISKGGALAKRIETIATHGYVEGEEKSAVHEKFAKMAEGESSGVE